MLVCPLHIWGTCLRVLSNVFLHFEIRCFCNYKFIETPFRIKWKTKRFKAKRQVNKHRHLWTRKKCMWSRKVGRDNFILHYVSRQRQKHLQSSLCWDNRKSISIFQPSVDIINHLLLNMGITNCSQCFEFIIRFIIMQH